MLGNYIFVLVVYSTCISQSPAWETPSPHQYHIQTDEGPERYFRYQTDSGQYRKEKRLEDGTVVGTYAWIDADGILRQRDYIADNAGYRILKNKNVYVGRNINVGEAVITAKKYPATAGSLVKTGLQHTRPVVAVPYRNQISSSYIPSTTITPLSYIPSTTASPLSYVTSTPAAPLSNGYNYVSSTTVSPLSNTHSYIPSTTSAPSTYFPSTTGVAISNVSPNSVDSSTPFRIIIPTEPLVEITPNSLIRTYDYNNLTYFSSNHLVSTPRITTESPSLSLSTPIYSPEDFGGSHEVDHNSLEYNPYVRHVQNNYRFQNGPTYPLDKNGRPYVGFEPKSQTYDGVSVTNDGFRYYIPRAYHEEETVGDTRSGSFGYIDPFGIRRVIYYNTAPGSGFQHRKNNRYVGFNAPPYDPRPY